MPDASRVGNPVSGAWETPAPCRFFGAVFWRRPVKLNTPPSGNPFPKQPLSATAYPSCLVRHSLIE